MKKIIVLLITILSHYASAQKLDTTQFHLVEPKVGLKNYPIDKTKLPEIIAAFGDNYDKNQDFVFLKSKELPEFYEVKYKNLGISFYFFDNDSTQTIKAIKFYKPFKAKTTTNIILNKSNIAKVLKTYKSSDMVISQSAKWAKVSVNESKLTTTGISFSSQIANFHGNKFLSKKALKRMVIDEIYISNYQYFIFLD
ncbi:hypothetical protein AAGV28_09345 [Flavobacterium sp. FZUC8N2.13]|uniref:Uncharacterized protein n=1 Tax=Flavobacterium zubiriense TaxID=3138075 RepID=A0ABV4TDU1_9FLAO